MGAWIEISDSVVSGSGSSSLLSWERGLKYPTIAQVIVFSLVAPLVGAWIEICPLGALMLWLLASLLSWERGLK